MSAVLVIARIAFSILFLTMGIGHLAKLEAMTGYAKYKKLPAAKLGVILSGLMMIVGSLSIIFGYLVDLGALLIAIFVVLAAFLMHGFWAETDATAKMNEQTAFFKDLALGGAAVIIYGYVHFIATIYKDGSPLLANPQTKPLIDGFLQGFGWVVSKGHIFLWK